MTRRLRRLLRKACEDYPGPMCDTLYVPARSTGCVSAFFAKNSDRHPDEPQIMEAVSGAGLPCLLSRPVWMRGAEMGINARGVVIGNEAVFARWKASPKGTLGMDTLRDALEAAESAEQAVDHIARFVESHDQGGNGAYRGSLSYHNSYLAADFREAWIIETAGRRWAAKRLDGPGAISNTYSLRDDWQRADAATLAERKSGASWKSRVESRLYPLITQGERRRACSLAGIGGDGVGLERVFVTMRSHGRYDLRRPNLRNMESLCMHEGGLVNNATTASMVVQLRAADQRAVIWFTASPSPCLSLYRPALLENGTFRILWDGEGYGTDVDVSTLYWKRRRETVRRLQRTAFRDPTFTVRRDEAQARLTRLVTDRSGPADDARLRTEINAVVAEFERAG